MEGKRWTEDKKFHQQPGREVEMYLDKDGVYKPKKDILLVVQEIIKSSQIFLDQKVWPKVKEYLDKKSTRF